MNVPYTFLDSAQNILIVGLGGGYDIYAGLPFVSNWRFTRPNVPFKKFVMTTANSLETNFLYKEIDLNFSKRVVKTYSMGRLGVQSLRKAYEEIIDLHQIDAILAVDGGVDSLMTGDEQEAGTILEDFINLFALGELKLPKILACIGFGTETEENINHFRALENIANLIKNDGFIGSFSLCRKDEEYKEYKAACEARWQTERISHVQSKVISAVEGQFGYEGNLYGDVDPKLVVSTGISFISPLSSMYWMFHLDKVVEQNKMKCLKQSNTFIDAKMLLRNYFETNKPSRDKQYLPF